MKHLKKFNESFDSHSLIVGSSYKITLPSYDDYDEGWKIRSQI
jgi:hypothetical protein